MIWKCPNCHAALVQDSRLLKCENNHSFDLAKQGYTNLLLTNQKKSKNPGDNEDMIDARQRFLNAGFYEPLVEKLQPFIHQNSTVFDLGCGEGYYLRSLISAIPKIIGYGIDISKPGVKKAAQQSKASQFHNTAQPYAAYAVASTYRIPVQNDSVDTAISVFAPFDEKEVQRILKAKGTLVRVGPGAKHHQQIKDRLYQTAEEHTLAVIPEGFYAIQQEELIFDITLSGKVLIEDLIPMTPFHWQGSKEVKAELAATETHIITAHFQIDVLGPEYKLNGHTGLEPD